MIDAGKYNKKITIFEENISKDSSGFDVKTIKNVLVVYAHVKTTKGFTLIMNDSDFEKAYTNFTIRFPQTQITRKMKIAFNNKTYSIEYLNNIDEKNIELEIQAKEITH